MLSIGRTKSLRNLKEISICGVDRSDRNRTNATALFEILLSITSLHIHVINMSRSDAFRLHCTNTWISRGNG